MKHYLKRISLILAIVMVFSAQFTFSFASETTATSQIVVLHTNDVHSRVDANIGYASVKGWKDYYEAQGAKVIVLDAGDAIHGLPIANLGEGKNIVDIMNAVGYTAMVPGNHDFNYGIARLLELEKSMNFDLLSSNTTKINGEEAFTPSKLYTFDGVKIGIVGISTPETETKTNPLNVKGYTFNSDKIVDLVQTQINKLDAEGADYIIALGHLGTDEESAPYRSTDVIAETQGIDIFIDGHSHTVLENGQLVKDKDGQEVMLAQTGDYLEAIGNVTIDNGKISASLIKDAKPDASVAKLIEEKQAEIKPMLDTIVAKTNVSLNGERDPGVRTGETNLGDLAADAIKYVSGADVALTNGGGIRVSLPTGNISYGALNAVFPFGNIVVKIDITGEQLLSALENGTKQAPNASGAFPQVAGIDFEINTDLTKNRVQNVKINGEALELTKTYSLATNDFTQAGGDGYTMLTDCKKTGEYGALDEALVEYIEKELDGEVGQEYASDKGRIKIVKSVTSPLVAQFTDISTHPAKTAITLAVNDGLFNGVNKTTFSPDTKMTRAMLVTVLGRLKGLNVGEYKESSFSDVSITSWYGGYAQWAFDKKITSYINSKMFLPNEGITREEMATILTNYCTYIGKGPFGSWAIMLDYTDLDKASDWANEGIMFCTMKGYMKGYDDGTFKPNATVTRAEAAAILKEFADSIRADK